MNTLDLFGFLSLVFALASVVVSFIIYFSDDPNRYQNLHKFEFLALLCGALTILFYSLSSKF